MSGSEQEWAVVRADRRGSERKNQQENDKNYFFPFSRLVCLDHRLWPAPDAFRNSGALEVKIITTIIIMLKLKSE